MTFHVLVNALSSDYLNSNYDGNLRRHNISLGILLKCLPIHLQIDLKRNI